MKLFAIYGNPVAHSRSPLMHNSVFRAHGIDACYTRVHLLDGAQLRSDFFARGLCGANVTVPHKEAAFAACDEVRGFAQKVGVVNTLVREGERLIGYNTDADGFIDAMHDFETIRTVAVLGAGGTAKALVQRFVDEGYEVHLINRSKERLEAYAWPAHTYTWSDTAAIKALRVDMVVNTTSAGLSDNTMPLPQSLLTSLLAHSRYAADVIYGHTTPFLHMARSMQLSTIDGAAMLLGQGVLANALFIDHALPLETIRAAMQRSFEL
ncbi:MAG: shikimate dehydrogenase [Sulfuricurvum sp. PC08-66]|nr:MAG: shikimate dehydrogenase [Sulfuricurvum sp. PC08-66]